MPIYNTLSLCHVPNVYYITYFFLDPIYFYYFCDKYCGNSQFIASELQIHSLVPAL